MPDLISTIRTALSGVVAQFADSALPIYYRALTSAYNANPRTWGAWTLVPGARVFDYDEGSRSDPIRNVHTRRGSYVLHIPFTAGVDLGRDSQIRVGDNAGLIYSIESQRSNAAGSSAEYVIAWTEPEMVNPRTGSSI